MTRARDQRRERLADVGQAYLAKHKPSWLPQFVTRRVLKDWCREQGRRPKILDTDVITRDHAGYKSYQQFLLVQEPKSLARGVPRSLARRLMVARDSFIRRCGAIGALWGMLALAAFWLDRLTRGYMTMRLTFLAITSGVLGPIIIMLL